MLLVVILIGCIDYAFELHMQSLKGTHAHWLWRNQDELLPALRGLAGLLCVCCWMFAATAIHKIIHLHEEIKLIREPGKLAQAEYLLMALQGIPAMLLSVVASMSAEQWLNWQVKSGGANTNLVLEASFVVCLFALPMLWTLLLLAVGMDYRWVGGWFVVFCVLPQLWLPLLVLSKPLWSGPHSAEHFYVSTGMTWRFLYPVSWLLVFVAIINTRTVKLRIANTLLFVLLLGGFIFSWNGPLNTVLPISDSLAKGFHASPLNYVLDFVRAISESVWHPLGRGYFIKEDDSFGIHFMVPFSFLVRWPHETWVIFPFLSVCWLLAVAVMHFWSIPILMRSSSRSPNISQLTSA